MAEAKQAGREVRSLGRWSLVAVGINFVIGSGFFLFPARLYDEVGPWSPLLVIVVGLAMLPIALTFAEVGSRFSRSGGPYAYVHAAFGQTAAFEIAWLLWISRVVSQAAVLSGLLLLLTTLLPAPVTSGQANALAILATGAIAAFSIAGGNANRSFINVLTLLKVAPVVALIGYGLAYVDWSHFENTRAIGLPQVSSASLLILYSFAGFELLSVPAGEARDPARDVPIALLIALASAGAIMALANVIVIGTIADPSRLEVALADAAGALWGSAGSTLLLSTAIVAILGHNASSLLSASRLLYAASVNGELPRVLARLHARFHTPWVAVLISAAAVIVLTVSRSFEWLVILAAGTRILVYAAVASAAWKLRTGRGAEAVAPAAYVAPYPRTMTCLALLTCGLLMTAIDTQQLAAIAAAALLGLIVFRAQRTFVSHGRLA